jgi:hypothetical protein
MGDGVGAREPSPSSASVNRREEGDRIRSRGSTTFSFVIVRVLELAFVLTSCRVM